MILNKRRVGVFFSRSSFSTLHPHSTNMGLLDIVPAGVVTGDNLRKLMNYGKDKKGTYVAKSAYRSYSYSS